MNLEKNVKKRTLNFKNCNQKTNSIDNFQKVLLNLELCN